MGWDGACSPCSAGNRVFRHVSAAACTSWVLAVGAPIARGGARGDLMRLGLFCDPTVSAAQPGQPRHLSGPRFPLSKNGGCLQGSREGGGRRCGGNCLTPWSGALARRGPLCGVPLPLREKEVGAVQPQGCGRTGGASGWERWTVVVGDLWKATHHDPFQIHS